MANTVERLSTALAGRYVFERELGAGGMATVYLTADLKHHRKVAVKVLRPEFAAALGQDRFLKEIEILSHLTHPHILPLHDSGVVDDVCFFVMPYIAGESLRSKLDREGQLPVEEAVQITREIADALAYAHAHGVVHRDIKPHNIMVESGHAVLADFGIALPLDTVTRERLTETGFSPGTPHYMSPEQSNSARRLDGRSDIYSLGCVLYEMLAGDPPFTGPNLYAIMARHAVEPPPNLRIARPTISESLERATFRALAKVPADRFRTATEFVQALTEVSNEYVRPMRTARLMAPPSIEQGRPVPLGTSLTEHSVVKPKPTFTTFLWIVSGGLLLSTAIGFLNTTIYDLKLEVPYLYTPTRIDFPVIGIRALIPALYVGLILLIAYVIVKYILRLFFGVLSRRPSARNTLGSWRERASALWQRTFRGRTPETIAELWFLVALAASAAVLAPFLPFLASLTNEETELLSCSARELHYNFTSATTALIVGVALSWNWVVRHVQLRTHSGFSIALARWGGLAWIVILTLVLTSPWRLLWGENPRALLDGERVYIIKDDGADLLLYRPDRGSTDRLSPDQADLLHRLDAPGYIFETRQAFDDEDPRC